MASVMRLSISGMATTLVTKYQCGEDGTDDHIRDHKGHFCSVMNAQHVARLRQTAGVEEGEYHQRGAAPGSSSTPSTAAKMAMFFALLRKARAARLISGCCRAQRIAYEMA